MPCSTFIQTSAVKSWGWVRISKSSSAWFLRKFPDGVRNETHLPKVHCYRGNHACRVLEVNNS